MFITRMSLPRRTFLRGVGATVALPLLDSMVPALTALARTAANPVRRFGAIYLPHGAIMNQWTPATAGTGFELSPILQPLARVRSHVVIVSGLIGHPMSNGGAHAIAPGSWLTGVAPKKTEAKDVSAGTTIDQVLAKAIGQDTLLPSLEVATEDFGSSVGACDTGYSCTYMNTISWQTPTTPLPMEINPRVVFERMFGGAGTPEQRLARIQANRSILDSVTQETTRLQKGLGARERTRLRDYLDHVREIERRIETAEKRAHLDVSAPAAPIGVPEEFADHVALMFDLLTVAYQADITRVFTFMMAREASQRTYAQIGVSDPHHSLSHHSNRPDKIANHAKVNAYHVQLFSRFLDTLGSTPDGDGTLLDHSIVLYGSGMSNGNTHSFGPLPLLVAGGGGGRITGGRHLANPETTPIANLHVSLAEKAGVALERFGNSTGRLDL